MNTVNPIVKLIAWTVVGLIAAAMAVAIGLVILGVGKAHAAGTMPHAFVAVSHAERGGHGRRA
jgi:hypothetical protein